MTSPEAGPISQPGDSGARARAGDASREDRTRDALTRVLAVEGRNALARVELAASELARFETTPSMRDRIDTIRHAASEIDGLLGKIDRLSAGRPRKTWPAIGVSPAWERVRERLGPSLAARGFVLEAMTESRSGEGEGEGESDCDGRGGRTGISVVLPEAVLDRMLFGLLRAGVSGAVAPTSLRGIVSRSDRHVLIALEGAVESSPIDEREIAREARVELEVQLAEWGGDLDRSRAGRMGLRLPREPSNG